MKLLIVFCLLLNLGTFDKSIQNDFSFGQFFRSFSKDSVFQLTRIKFPLDYFSLDKDGTQEEMIIEKDEWTFIDFTGDVIAYKQETDKFKPFIKRMGKDNVTYTREGVDNGIHIEYTFHKIDGKWTLVKVFDTSN
jgi:hypothetical protein